MCMHVVNTELPVTWLQTLCRLCPVTGLLSDAETSGALPSAVQRPPCGGSVVTPRHIRPVRWHHVPAAARFSGLCEMALVVHAIVHMAVDCIMTRITHWPMHVMRAMEGLGQAAATSGCCA